METSDGSHLPWLPGPERRPPWTPGSKMYQEEPPAPLPSPSAAGALSFLLLCPSLCVSTSTSVHLSSFVLCPFHRSAKARVCPPFSLAPLGLPLCEHDVRMLGLLQALTGCLPLDKSQLLSGSEGLGLRSEGPAAQAPLCLLVPAGWPTTTLGQGLAGHGDRADGSRQRS